MSLLVLIVLIVLLVAAMPRWGYNSNWGYGPSSGLGLVLLAVVVLMVLGHIPRGF